MKKIISTLLIVLGLILIVSPFINDILIKNKISSTNTLVQEITAQQIEENTQAMEDPKEEEGQDEVLFNYDAIEDVQITTTLSEVIRFKKEDINKNIIGQIIIDDLNIDLPILKGVTNSNLLIGAGTMKSGLVMGEGNYSLAGHYMKDGLLFGNLLDIQKGTKVKVTNKLVVYEYEIYDTQIVPDTSFYMLGEDRAIKRGKPIISLMTCYFTSKNGKRFFALGELVAQYPYDQNLIVNWLGKE